MVYPSLDPSVFELKYPSKDIKGGLYNVLLCNTSKDFNYLLTTTISKHSRDEILEISKTYYGNLKDISHTLIKFDTNDNF